MAFLTAGHSSGIVSCFLLLFHQTTTAFHQSKEMTIPFYEKQSIDVRYLITTNLPRLTSPVPLSFTVKKYNPVAMA
jgi:hypothetical protein